MVFAGMSDAFEALKVTDKKDFSLKIQTHFFCPKIPSLADKCRICIECGKEGEEVLHLVEDDLVDGLASLVDLGDLLVSLLGVSRLSSGGLLAGAGVSNGLVATSNVDGLLLDGAALEGSGVGVQVEEGLVVDEGVLAVNRALVGLLGAEMGLDLGGVDDAAQVGVGDGGTGDDETRLLLGEDVVESGEGRLGPDEEATNVTSGGELEEVETVDVGDLEAGNVAESLANVLTSVGDEEGAATLDETSVAGLTVTGTESAGGLDALDVLVGVDGLEDLGGLLGLGDSSEVGGGDDEGDLGDLADTVTTGLDKSGDGRRGKGGNDGETTLSLVYATMPAAPDLGGGEHASSTAHVTEGSLTGTVGTSSSNTRDTRNGATSSPRLGRGLGSRVARDGISLAVVLSQVGMHGVHDIHTDGGLEHGGQLDRGGGLSAHALD